MENAMLSQFITTRFLVETVFDRKAMPWEVLSALSDKNDRTILWENFRSLIEQDYTLLEKLQAVPEKYDKKSAQNVVGMFTETSATRLVLQGVYHDVAKKTLVATNGKYLAFCDMLEDEKESLVIDEAGKIIEGVFPRYQEVIPTKFTFKTEINDVDFYAGYLKCVNNLSACVKLGEVYTMLKGVCFRTDLLYTVFSAFAKIGAKSIEMKHAIEDTSSMIAPVRFEGSGLTVVLMPAHVKGDEFNLDNCKPPFALCPVRVGFAEITCIPGHILEDYSPKMTDYRISDLKTDIKTHLIDVINGAFYCIIKSDLQPDIKKVAKAFKAMTTLYDTDTTELLRDIKRVVTKIKTRKESINNLSAFLRLYAKLIARYNTLPGSEQVTFLTVEEIKSTILKSMIENKISPDDIAVIESIKII